MNNKPEHKKIGFWDCMSLSIGQIIGSGVMVLTGIVVGLTGHGAPYGYIVGALLTLCLSVPFILLSSTIPASGVGYNSVKRLVGDRAAFLFIGMFILSQVLIATFAKGFAGYFVAVIPGANETVVALAALIICTLINIIGLKTSAKVQNGMIILLLVSLALFIGFGLPKVDWYSLRPAISNVMPNGAQSFFTGAVLLSFACGGAHFIAENGNDIEDAPHTIPKVIILSTSIVAVFYALGTYQMQLGYQPYAFITQLIGASGAIYGILLAFAVIFPKSRIYVWFVLPVPAPLLVLVYALIEFFAQFSRSSNVAHYTHLAGFAAAFFYFIVRMGINPIKVWKDAFRK